MGCFSKYMFHICEASKEHEDIWGCKDMSTFSDKNIYDKGITAFWSHEFCRTVMKLCRKVCPFHVQSYIVWLDVANLNALQFINDLRRFEKEGSKSNSAVSSKRSLKVIFEQEDLCW